MPDTPAQASAQDQSGTTPGATAPVANPAPAQAPAQGRPWDNDLGFIQDPAVKSQVSDYLAQTWQPRMTQVEQENAAAKSLYEDFRSNPRDTLREVADELLEAGLVQAADLQFGETPPEVQPEVQPPVEATEAQAQRDPEVQLLIDRERERAEKEAFDAEYQRVKQAHPDLHLDYDLYLQAVADTGDFDQAVEQYQDKYGEYDRFLASQATEPPPAEPTPPPVGSVEGGTGEVPVEEKYETLDDAIDAHFAEEAARGVQPQAAVPSAPPPPVAAG